MANFFAELGPRHIFRLGAGYVVVAWATSQFIGTLSQISAMPPWIGRPVAILLVIGLPIAPAIAWRFDRIAHQADLSAVRAKSTVGNRLLAGGLIAVLAIIGCQPLMPRTFAIGLAVAAENLPIAPIDEEAIRNGVPVTDHGAIANDNIDDTDAIANAILATPSGGTTSFPTGEYLVSSAIQLDSNKNYLSHGAVLRSTGNSVHIFQISDRENIVIQGLTFDGAGIRLSGNLVENVDIVGNIFRNIFIQSDNFGDSSAVTVFSDRYLNSYIQANIFLDIGHRDGTWVDDASGILGFHFDNSHVLDNRFDHVTQPISIIWEGVGGSTVVARNHITGSYRMAIELHGEAEGITAQENIVNDPAAGMGLSIVLNTGHTSKVLNNEVNGLNTPSESEWFAMAIEVAGVGTLVEGNTIRGNWGCFICVGGLPPQYSTVKNNYGCGYNSTYDPIDAYQENPSVFEGNVVDDVCTTSSGAVAEPSPSRVFVPER